MPASIPLGRLPTPATPPPAATVCWSAVALAQGLSPSLEATMALVFAVVLGLLILEVARSRRKPNPTSPDPASLALLHTLHPHAAGIDVGAAELWVCVPPGAVSIPRPPADLQAIAAWLHQCGVTTVAMASTGVYWIPLYDLLEQAGFEVLLVDPRQVQRAPNRPKTDVHDCQWIQRLHSHGLLTAAFRPEEPIRV